MLNRSWSVMAEVPYWERTAVEEDEVTGLLDKHRDSGFGDIRLTALYTGFSPDLSTGLKLGVKLPTGKFHTPGFERDFVSVAKDFFHSETYQRQGNKLVTLDVPDDATATAQREWLLVETRSAWTTGGATYPSGALLAIRYDDFMAGKRDFTVLFRPDAHTSLGSYSWTRHHLILDVLDDVKSRLEVLTPQPGDWKRESIAGAPAKNGATSSWNSAKAGVCVKAT